MTSFWRNHYIIIALHVRWKSNVSLPGRSSIWTDDRLGKGPQGKHHSKIPINMPTISAWCHCVDRRGEQKSHQSRDPGGQPGPREVILNMQISVTIMMALDMAYIMSMDYCKTAISPLLTYGRYCSLAPSHRCDSGIAFLNMYRWISEIPTIVFMKLIITLTHI